jgi:uracil-DNA glycosylase
MINKLEKLNKTIINCNKCKRLVDFRKKIASMRKLNALNIHNYWGRANNRFW